MKKTKIILAASACVLLMDCQTNHPESKEVSNTAANTRSSLLTTTTTNSFIPLDSANKMIQSYLNSISSGDTVDNLHSIIFNADSLRRMLNDESNGKITSIKISFAHKLDYINDGNSNINCGYHSEGLTLVISGFDDNNDYIFYPSAMVMNVGRPCPPSCPVTGTASDDLFPVQ